MSTKVPLKKKKATTVADDGAVTLYQTVVFRKTKTGFILNSGGWRTKTTKDRMNQALRENGLPFSVYQEKRQWFVWNRESGDTMDFSDNMEIQYAE